MLTRLEIDGFKSLQDFAVDLEPFTVFIGPNSAGKSNVFEALALLSRLVTQPIAEAFKHGRGRPSDQFTRHGADGDAASKMRFAVEYLDGGDSRAYSRYRYELTIERRTTPMGMEQLVAGDERFILMRPEDDRWLEAHPEFAALVRYVAPGAVRMAAARPADSSEQRFTTVPDIWPADRPIPPTHTALATIVRQVGDAGIRRALGSFCFLRPDVARLGEPSDPLDSGELASDAANLPTIIAGLSPPELGALRADLVALVPGLASLAVSRADDALRIDFELSGGEHMPARLISDGTLRILLLLTALRLSPRPSLIAIEEPENGIYPGRLRALLEFLVDATKHDQRSEADGPATQILVTSHSPEIVAALRKHPQHLRFVDAVRRDGRRATRVRTVGASASAGRTSVSLKEIDQILNAVRSDDP